MGIALTNLVLIEYALVPFLVSGTRAARYIDNLPTYKAGFL